MVDTREVESRVLRVPESEVDDWLLDEEGTGLEVLCRIRCGVRIRQNEGGWHGRG